MTDKALAKQALKNAKVATGNGAKTPQVYPLLRVFVWIAFFGVVCVLSLRFKVEEQSTVLLHLRLAKNSRCS
jgi:hypothetical protein